MGANEAATLLSAADVPRGQHEPDVSQGPTSGAEAGLPGCFTPIAPPQCQAKQHTSYPNASLKTG